MSCSSSGNGHCVRCWVVRVFFRLWFGSLFGSAAAEAVAAEVECFFDFAEVDDWLGTFDFDKVAAAVDDADPVSEVGCFLDDFFFCAPISDALSSELC